MHEAHAQQSPLFSHQSTHHGESPGTAHWVAAAALAVLAAAAIVVVQRRAAGALTAPLDAAGLLAVAGAAGGWALAIRIAAHRSPPRRRPLAAILYVGPALALAALAAGLSVAETPAAGVAALWGGLACTELLAVSVVLSPRVAPRQRRQPQELGQSDAPPSEPERHAPTESVRLTLIEEPAGGQAWQGWIRASFEVGQRVAQEHVAFCPPLEELPEIRAVQAAGPPATITPGQILTYGARFDIRLDTPALEPTCVELTFQTQARRADTQDEASSAGE